MLIKFILKHFLVLIVLQRSIMGINILMRNQILLVNKILLKIFLFFSFLLITSCSFSYKSHYNSNIVDDSYFDLINFKKNYKGMTKNQVIYIFGNPIISDSFNNAYHYIFCDQFNRNICNKKTLSIFFKKNKVLYFTVW
ncbi:hypothetical protein DD681_02105 [Buchnera aphidicola (Melanaphis sacchari)]|uniref:Outer membrane protein assembly factor BamE n=1 Tax=Buchnera aphidicola (Melanaphis sacchari) TaxID=2173854 RepID=A0A2U8DFU2_9GAMM|nr:outer membrane protein assembly factor BamE [Buchnera aphidicola]AWH90583.1 hypothetical protein DD681_02105 [Buchnera aphidicola (Melanaphis sacchari)]